ncbi:MAG TPA: metalloregulator ArsR/SmtB family transcription factor [Candidatus Binatia bacterium]|nr:metalloregulator ArsR/SmtB family transcription factor [Candidatus Binatia bacterium]
MFESDIDAEVCSTDCRHPAVVEPLLGRSLSAHGAREVGELFAVLADPSRARILHLLAISDGELCVCDMALVIGMSVSALSHQLRFLRERGAVERRKVGRVAWYRLVDDHLRDLVVGAATHVAERQ